MVKQLSGSSRQEKLRIRRKPPITPELLAELAVIESMTGDEIDTSDIPEHLDWNNAEIGKFYRPIKAQISLRIDTDILNWFKAKSKQYTTLINQALRVYVVAEEMLTTKKSVSKKIQDISNSKKIRRRKHA